jgi:glycosyltransferase involved in cell wall biosynthesis
MAKQALVIAGTGPEETQLKVLAQQLGADVIFCGYLTGVKLQTAMKQARAFVLPSEWYENAPVSVLEAYALGRPVLGAAIGGIPELIQEGITGFTFASGNVAELAATLARVASMPDRVVEEMGAAGRRWIESNFTPKRYRDRMLELYGEVSASDRVTMPQSGKHLLEGN